MKNDIIRDDFSYGIHFGENPSPPNNGQSKLSDFFALSFTRHYLKCVIKIFGKWQEAGLDRIMLQWIELDELNQLEDLAHDVLPHFHK